jgi:uncharacterized protein YajQ (UPF0234 family)
MPSFDVVSRTDLQEVDNAVQGAMREISTRYDFKGSNCLIERSDETLMIRADDDFKLKQVQEMLRGHMAKRKVDAGAFDFAKPEKAFLHAANLADDADTVAAITGQLAGAIWGASAIPEPWLAKLAWSERITKLSDDLLDGAE